MPSIAARCHELRIPDDDEAFRIIYRLDHDAIVIGEVFSKKTTTTPKSVISRCQRRFRSYDRIVEEKGTT
jgi:phage-related protein